MTKITDEFKKELKEACEKIECQECGEEFYGHPEENLSCDGHPF
jgi:hypothetical protein